MRQREGRQPVSTVGREGTASHLQHAQGPRAGNQSLTSAGLGWGLRCCISDRLSGPAVHSQGCGHRPTSECHHPKATGPGAHTCRLSWAMG